MLPLTRLAADVVLRPLRDDDGAALAAAYVRNRDHLSPWEPTRDDAFFTEADQANRTRASTDAMRAETSFFFVLEADDGSLVGRVNVSDVVRGAFQNAHLGYWVDAAYAGRGLMTAAVEAVVAFSRDDLGLHRLQAGTLVHNEASQTVLRRTGFTRIGLAPGYLQIAGRWQDHVLYQRLLHT